MDAHARQLARRRRVTDTVRGALPLIRQWSSLLKRAGVQRVTSSSVVKTDGWIDDSERLRATPRQ
ncbi:MAG: hypothetical protein V3V97_00650, partial [Hyphomicrobiaceae bacterium]